MTYNEFSTRHHAWVEAMGWHKRTNLEAMAMIYSEVGESVDEMTSQGMTSKFPGELADIVLRTVDMALENGINVDFERQHYSPDRPAYRTTQACLLCITSVLAKGVNASRTQDADSIIDSLVGTLLLCEEIAARQSIDLQSVIEQKIEINLARGSRGRSI
ncbi:MULTISPECIES: hypothetical protein [Pseudomonas]|uniref:hypothetical protein n=1 Tax=Pseudomonas TaxID=286 RepID=UPI000F01230A|nr:MULTISPECIES: hypothetical protein [Pseudomonas]MBD8681228.1 hypothetical protein [Pseudomonas sp. CFBP 13719]